MNALYEIVAFRPSTALPVDIQGTVLQIAADRWLFIDRQPELPAGFAATDVTGKWREIQLTSAAKLLANTVDVEALLAGRACARTALFDCPAILVRRDSEYAVWVERSYEHAFNLAIQQVAAL